MEVKSEPQNFTNNSLLQFISDLFYTLITLVYLIILNKTGISQYYKILGEKKEKKSNKTKKKKETVGV